MLNTLIECYRGSCDSSNFKRSLGELKLIKDLKVAKGVIDVAANAVPRISATEESKDAKEVVTILGERAEGMDRRRIRLLNEVSTWMVEEWPDLQATGWKDRV